MVIAAYNKQNQLQEARTRAGVCFVLCIYYATQPRSAPMTESVPTAIIPKNGTRWSYIYNGRPIESRICSIELLELRYFQWPWTTPNLFFKVTPFFDTSILNGYRYGHSYYRMRIGNRTQPFEWHQFQWPWVTSKPDFKLAILFNVNGRPTESHTWSIEPCHLQWLWTSPNQPTRSTQPSTLHGMVKWVSAFGLSNNNKWRWWV